MSYSDKEIIDCLSHGGDKKVLEHLYLDIFPKVKRYIKSNSGTEDDALDIFQDAMVILCKQIRRNKFDYQFDLHGFVFSVCRNLWINIKKKQKRGYQYNESVSTVHHDDFTDSIVTHQKEKGLHIITELLGKKCFELLKRSIFYKDSSDEIQTKMGFASINAIKTQKYKCKQKLFKILDENPKLQEVIE